MKPKKRIGLVAHDNKKKDLVEWLICNDERLFSHDLVCTGTTGKLVKEILASKLRGKKGLDAHITVLKSGPLGGDQQLGSLVAEGKVDLMIFLWDPMQAQPHDVDVKALLRITALYNIPTATNRSTADFLISSPLLNKDYKPSSSDYSKYILRDIAF